MSSYQDASFTVLRLSRILSLTLEVRIVATLKSLPGIQHNLIVWVRKHELIHNSNFEFRYCAFAASPVDPESAGD